jgi:sigma-B regulation protein RsbU (phosphoserine phosphatase)
MHESDGSAARMVQFSPEEHTPVTEVSDAYMREQLEKRRVELNLAISTATPEVPTAPFAGLLGEVDSAIERIEEGTFGVCVDCRGVVEKERLLADPLVKVCLDCLPAEERRALERDLELASSVQRGLLPEKSVRFADWHIHYEYKPAGLVSGDYCDLIVPRHSDGKMVFLLGDVSGKGLAASLLMTHLHAMFRALSSPEPSAQLELDKMMETANRVFCESTLAGQFATLVCGWAGNSGELELASAGHLPAMLVRRDGVKQFSATGLPLGMFSSSRYAVQRVRLEPGDSLLLYTDGITEARNSAGFEYTPRKLARVAGERHRSSPADMLAACMKDVDTHSGGARLLDDQTLMVIHRNETGGLSLND